MNNYIYKIVNTEDDSEVIVTSVKNIAIELDMPQEAIDDPTTFKIYDLMSPPKPITGMWIKTYGEYEISRHPKGDYKSVKEKTKIKYIKPIDIEPAKILPVETLDVVRDWDSVQDEMLEIIGNAMGEEFFDIRDLKSHLYPNGSDSWKELDRDQKKEKFIISFGILNAITNARGVYKHERTSPHRYESLLYGIKVMENIINHYKAQ